MKKGMVRDAFRWGFLLWLFGYILGIAFFAFIPNQYLGWAIMPFGIAATLFVLLKKVRADNVMHFLQIAVIWTVMAILLDYLMIVKLLKPADGYYKLDVYLYYLLTFMLPLLVGWRKLTAGK